MSWDVGFADEFEPEFDQLSDPVQNELLACAKLLERFGPTLGRPRVDTLNDSRHSNMKELRFNAANGVWRVAFAFDPARRAVLLVAADKAGVKQKRFYKRLIALADQRFDDHLKRLEWAVGKSLKEKIDSLPAERRELIEARAAEMIDEELTLRELRKALELTQTALASRLNVGQETISRLERRTDMLLSTLDEYVQALGGRLELNVEFPGRTKIRLKSLRETKDKA